MYAFRVEGIDPLTIEMAKHSPAGWALLCGNARFGDEWQLGRHLAIVNRMIMDELALDTGGRLLVESPPRHGKSELISRYLVGWHMCRWPGRKVLLLSSSKELAAEWARKAREDVEDFGQLVFGVRVDPASGAAHSWKIDGFVGGGLYAAGVGTRTSGRGADLLITDDLMPGPKEAKSEVTPNAIWDWLQGVALKRLQPGACHVSVMTRWNEGDPHGRLWDGPRPYRRVKFPAIAIRDGDVLGRKKGEALWPEMWPVSELEMIRKETPPSMWSALYQQEPSPEEGAIWLKRWWDKNRYTVNEDGSYQLGPSRISDDGLLKFTTVDLAFSERKTADFTSIMTVGLTAERPRRMLVLSLRVERLPFPKLFGAIREEMDATGSRVVYIEEEGQQIMVIQAARQAGLPVKTIGRSTTVDFRISGNKEAVAHEATPMASSGRVWMPEAAPWLHDLEHSVLVFPNGAPPSADVSDTFAWSCLIGMRMGLRSGKPAVMPEGVGGMGMWDGMAPGGTLRDRMGLR